MAKKSAKQITYEEAVIVGRRCGFAGNFIKALSLCTIPDGLDAALVAAAENNLYPNVERKLAFRVANIDRALFPGTDAALRICTLCEMVNDHFAPGKRPKKWINAHTVLSGFMK